MCAGEFTVAPLSRYIIPSLFESLILIMDLLDRSFHALIASIPGSELQKSPDQDDR